MTDAEIDHLFTYAPPSSPEQADKYARIRSLTRIAGSTFDGTSDTRFSDAATALADLAKLINELAPDSADKTTAIRCLRMARMAANRAFTGFAGKGATFRVMADEELAKAEMWACAAIALDTPR